MVQITPCSPVKAHTIYFPVQYTLEQIDCQAISGGERHCTMVMGTKQRVSLFDDLR